MNSDPAVVTVLLPVFNGEMTVAETISSIQSQTYPDWELMVLDDGSTDRSLEVCRACARKDRRIAVFANGTNQGLAKAMNRLISLARGSYIAVQEQDDVSLPERLECEVDVLESRAEVGLVSGIAAWVDDDNRVFAYFPGLLHRGEQYPQAQAAMVEYLYTEQCKVVNAACMFRRSIAGEIPGPFDEDARMSIDWQFFLHIAHRHRVFGIPRVLIRMRRGARHGSLTKRKELQFREARRCITRIYRCYRGIKSSPINYGLYRKAMATQLTLEGRFYGGAKGALRLVEALAFDPASRSAWNSALALSIRGLRRVSHFAAGRA
jgi:glycosyltransferase involved in cell wall biosynthesis